MLLNIDNLKNTLMGPNRWLFKIRSIGLITLCSGLVLTAPIAAVQGHATTTVQTRQAEIAYEKALINFQNSDLAEAKIHLKNGLKADPRHLSSRILMAEILIKEGDGAGAEVALNFAKERGADYNSLIVLYGYSYILQGKNKYLLNVIRSGNRGNNIETEIAYLRGQAYFNHKQIANARLSYQKALDRNPNFQKAKLGLAQIEISHKNYSQALPYIDSVLAEPKPDNDAWILKAKIYKRQGFTQKAIAAINKALSVDARNILSRITRASLLISVKNFKDAEKDVNFILDKYPREPHAQYLKAIITAARGDLSVSKANMAEILTTLRSLPPKLMEDNPSYYYLAGLTNIQFGNPDEARDNLHRYLKLEPDDVSAMRLLGSLELRAGDPLAANVVLASANRHQPNNPTTLTMLGLVYLKLGNIEKANYYLESVTKILPQSSESLANLARGKMAAGSFDEAINNLLKAAQHNLDNVDVKLLLIKAYQQSGQYDKALKIIQDLRRNEPDNPYLLNLYGTQVGLKGDLKEARKSYEKALQIDKNNLASLIYLSRMDVLEGRTDIAIDGLRTRLHSVPDDPNLMQELANIYRLLKNPKEALFWYKKAYAVQRNEFPALRNLVDGYVMNNDLKLALQTTAEFISRFPKHVGAYSLRGALFQRAGDPAQAIINFKFAVDYAIKRGDALLALADAQLKNNDRKAARQTLNKAVAWDPNLVGAYIALINMTVEDADPETGFVLLHNLRRITKPDNPAADILTGDLHLALKNYSQAEKSYHAALKTGDNSMAIIGLYKTYQQSGRTADAIAVLEGWYEKYPQDIRTSLALGNAYKRAGQMTKSVIFLENLLQRNPNMPLILNNAASANFAAGQEDKALDYARKANAALPDNANILDTLAWIETRRGDPETALPLLRRAMVLRFRDPEIKYHLAITLDKLNRRAEAHKLLSEVLSSEINFPERDTAEDTFKKWNK